MIKLQLSPGSPLLQISDFGSEVERTREGALHFRPGSVVSISDSEWEWIKRLRPDVAKELRQLPFPGPVAVKSKPVSDDTSPVESEQSECDEEAPSIALEEAPLLSHEEEPESESVERKRKGRRKN
ncbi:MAG: hypothetical protein DRJ65_07315 [Acidobacteria bacterium]|nr:MAG: hypothetical protein DRJ65_07315 [Acidobacteriota bacterium]